MNHIEGYESPMDPSLLQQQTPMQSRKQNTERTTNKRPRSYVSPSDQQQNDIQRKIDSGLRMMTHPSTTTIYSKITFPPIVVKFKANQPSSIKEITDDLTSIWKNQHGIDLAITARFGHMHSLLVFADDSSTFESLLDSNRWPKTLKEVDIELNAPRQLPPAYSLIIQQFHRNWNEDEWLTELQQRYVSLYEITRMRVQDGSPLNAVRADFKSIEEVKAIINSGKINIGSMIHPVKPYHLPIRINKCLKCLRHDHTTKSCSLPRLCPRCAEAHSLENGCSNREKCVNCGGGHISGHSACLIVQEKRRVLVEQANIQRAERQQQHYDFQGSDYPALSNGNQLHPSANLPGQTLETSQKSYAQAILNQHEQEPHKNIEYILYSYLNKIERRLDEFSSRLSSQLCDIEKKINVCSDRQSEMGNIIYEIVLPSIQELGRLVSQSSKHRNSQEDFKKFSIKINEILVNQKHQLNNLKPQRTSEHNDNPATNVSPQ